MAYLNSDKIKIFPSAKRGITKPYSRLTTEESFVRIVNKLIDTDGFVIGIDGTNIEFNIHGYYINADLPELESLFSSSTDIYAKIQLTTVGDNKELDGTDDASDEEYKGVVFSDSATSPLPSDTYELKILTRANTSDSWALPADSYFKFNDASFNFSIVVDGGVI